MKAILVFTEMPKSCDECEVRCGGYTAKEYSEKSIKPVPDREKTNDGSNVEFKMIDEAWTSGFNACLNEIIGGEEE